MKEDNIFKKLKKHNGTLHLVGDNFWLDLLDETFTRVEAVKSLDIYNYDDVDIVINKSLVEMIKQNEFDLILGIT